tara:strand:- start:2678 stop:3613 length:936 start_codon:yes stop_codon:yes gene_type:complete
MTNFLITGIGGDIAQGMAKIISMHYKDSQIIGCDIYRENAGPSFVKNFFIAPPASDEIRYLNFIESLITKYKIEILIPTSESELEVINKLDFSNLSCNLISPGERVINEFIDKYNTNNFLKSKGIDVPWTHKAEDLLPIEYPCIFKSRKGAGSKILYIVNDEDEAKYLSKKYKDSIFQELLLPNKNEITCAVFRSKKNEIRVLQLQRKLIGGSTSWAKTIINKEIDIMCKQVADNIDLLGSMNIQLRLTDNGPKIFEINPRFSSTLLMRHLIGFQDLIWAINDSLDIENSYTSIPAGIELARTQDAVILKK